MNKYMYLIVLVIFSKVIFSADSAEWDKYEEQSDNNLIVAVNNSAEKINFECGNLAHPLWLKLSVEPGKCAYVLTDVFKNQTVDCTVYQGIWRMDGISSISFKPVVKLLVSSIVAHYRPQATLSSAEVVNVLSYSKPKINFATVNNYSVENANCLIGVKEDKIFGDKSYYESIGPVLERAKNKVIRLAPERLRD